MNKSSVGMGQYYCPICQKKVSEVVLLHKHLKDTLTKQNFMGFELCEEHKKLFEDDYIAILAIDESKSEKPYTPANVYRTGAIVHIKPDAFKNIFDAIVPENEFNIVFCPDEVITELKKAVPIIEE